MSYADVKSWQYLNKLLDEKFGEGFVRMEDYEENGFEYRLIFSDETLEKDSDIVIDVVNFIQKKFYNLGFDLDAIFFD